MTKDTQCELGIFLSVICRYDAIIIELLDIKHVFDQPLQLGSLTLGSPLLQGPLAGYSCAPFRKLVWDFGGVGYCTTEMLSAHNIVHRPHQPARYRLRDDSETIWSVQLAGSQPEILARATEIVHGWGAEIIDLNCGCPQPKIRKRKMGSRLLSDPEHLYRCVKAMRDATDRVLTVKIRIEPDDNEANRQVAEAINSAGADGLIVHARHWTERYDVPARWSAIQPFVDWVSIPVIANGDVDSLTSLQAAHQASGCAGVMIARAGLGRPWLFHQILTELNSGKTWSISQADQAELLMQHVSGLVTIDGEHLALLQARKLVAYYFPMVTLSDHCVAMKNQLSTLSDLTTLLNALLSQN
ncbi:MAG: nitrogen regulation protein [Legionellales bacterium]|nr:nitrogen regulation protein [Legionellales bacterium]HAG62302.1 nitrogen regulation protein [Coxiellaceae bacterium]